MASGAAVHSEDCLARNTVVVKLRRRNQPLVARTADRRALHQARSDEWRLIVAMKWEFCALAVATTAVAAYLLWRDDGTVAGFALGLVVASVFWGIALLVVEVSGSAGRRMGAQAEAWTSSELRQLTSSGWRYLENVDVGSGDVDQVAIGPGGIYAIETKWIGVPLRGGYGRRRLAEATQQAAWGAQRIQARVTEGSFDLGVTAVVVLWGMAADEAPATPRPGVRVVHGTRLAEKLRAAPERLQPAQIDRAAGALTKYASAIKTAAEPRNAFIAYGGLGMLSRVASGLMGGVLALGAAIAVGAALGVAGLLVCALLAGSSVVVYRLVGLRHRHIAAGVAAGFVAATIVMTALVLWAWLTLT